MIEITQDGSPTLRQIISNDLTGESMHHSGGAASETYYIYGSVLEIFHQYFAQHLKTIVVGLGLAYIEMAWALAQAKYRNQNSTSVLDSFEVVNDLKNNFANWLQSSSTKSNEIYDQALRNYLTAAASLGGHSLAGQSEFDKIKKYLSLSLNQNLKLKNSILDDLGQNQKYNIICYDAFSQKTDSELWTEAFLEKFVKNHTENNCVWTTYACTGTLKRVLTNNGFKFYKRSGFKGKRDATFATRGEFTRVEPFDQTFLYNQ